MTERHVTVCDSCLTACCWHAELCCVDYQTAGTIDMPVSELRRLGYEHPSYWKGRTFVPATADHEEARP